jgi:methyl-accepting chemotaxis protein
MRYNATDFSKNYLRLLIPGITSDDVVQIKKSIAMNVSAFDEADKTYQALPFSEGEQGIYKAEADAWKEFHQTALKFVALHGSSKTEDQTEYLNLVSKILPKLRTTHAGALGKLMEFQTKEADAWIERAKSESEKGTIASWSLTLIGFVFAILFGILFSNALSKTLRDLAQRLSLGANEVASASQQVSSSSEELSSASSEQAASLEETTSSVEEMSAMIGKNAENAANSQTVAQSCRKTAESGKESVSRMMSSMDEIQTSNAAIMTQVEEGNKNLAEIVQVISEIGSKTKVINDIVFQTKLLSFNASVEAARAGEHGKGFAVVAEEVGKLAQMSGTAAKEISDMLDGSIKKVQNIVNETKSKVENLIAQSKEKVTIGTSIAKQCGEALDEMVSSVSEVSRMVSEIAMASQEQAEGVKQINQAMGQLDQTTQLNASGSQETASAAEELSSQADTLRTMVIELTRTIEGAAKTKENGIDQNIPLQNEIKARVASTQQTRHNNVVPIRKQKTDESKNVDVPSRTELDFAS